MQNWKDINGNSLQISVWSGDKSDKQLYSLAKLLLSNVIDIQILIKKIPQMFNNISKKDIPTCKWLTKKGKINNLRPIEGIQ